MSWLVALKMAGRLEGAILTDSSLRVTRGEVGRVKLVMCVQVHKKFARPSEFTENVCGGSPDDASPKGL